MFWDLFNVWITFNHDKLTSRLPYAGSCYTVKYNLLHEEITSFGSETRIANVIGRDKWT